ncbi:hypothetical protein GE107_10995 [Cohnella sp. CFH 77786]|uniref:hypothetical protein n=1 Tax=Cohnella sp. CFH 77786 TaxID=2662265 RepID=UPI001C60A1A6|nr:hypothetical protein [Cohnella sp. CFH 77786]MBW5446586.1 hypothetical protein [Cohnella sp. CFH 77786]
MEWLLLIPMTMSAVLLYVLLRPPVHSAPLDNVEETEAASVPVLKEENVPTVAAVHSASIFAGYAGKE